MSRRKSPAMDPLFDEQEEGRPWGRYALIAAIAGVGGFILYAAFAGGSAPQGPVPVIRADQTPWTRAPSEAGGMEIPNQDSVVYELMDKEGGTEAAAVAPATPDGDALQPPSPDTVASDPKTMDEVMKEATGEAATLSTGAVGTTEDKPVDTAGDKMPAVIGATPETPSVDKTVDVSADKAVEETADKAVENTVAKTEEKTEVKAEEKVEEKPVRDPELDAPYNPNKAKAASTTVPTSTAVAPAASGKRVTVRLGSMPGTDTGKAAAEFSRLKALSGGKLTGSPSYEPVTLSKGSFVRINTSMDEAAARSLCDTLSSKGAPCLILGQ